MGYCSPECKSKFLDIDCPWCGKIVKRTRLNDARFCCDECRGKFQGWNTTHIHAVKRGNDPYPICKREGCTNRLNKIQYSNKCKFCSVTCANLYQKEHPYKAEYKSHCEECGKPIRTKLRTRRHANGRISIRNRTRWCSPECKAKALARTPPPQVITCVICGKEIALPYKKYYYFVKKTCSQECRHLLRVKTRKETENSPRYITCKQCGQRVPCNWTTSKHFCNKACMLEYFKARIIYLTCPNCGKTFEAMDSHANKYCSMKCYQEDKVGKELHTSELWSHCKTCGKPFFKEPGSTQEYCSMDCFPYEDIQRDDLGYIEDDELFKE
jgi:hypothetical protein